MSEHWIDCFHSRIPRHNYPSTLYELLDGSFGSCVANSMGADYFRSLNLKQYIIITLNYVIHVVTRWEPELTIFPGGTL
jgi:hypothetical protein